MTNRQHENNNGGRRVAVRDGAITPCWTTWPSRSSSSCRGRPAAYAAIGKAVGLSEAAVRQRVQRLLDAGVMQIVAVTDPLQLGFPRQAMIGLRTTATWRRSPTGWPSWTRWTTW